MRMKDEERILVERVLAGRHDAFEPLVLPYRRALVTLAYRLLRDWEEAGDAAQEALFKAYRHLARFDTGRSFRNWLFQIAVNEARDRARRRGRETASLPELAGRGPAGDDPESGLRSAETRSDLLACLDALSPHEREVFVLRDLQEMNIRDTARTLGCSSVSVRVALSSARRKVRDRIRERFPHLETE